MICIEFSNDDASTYVESSITIEVMYDRPLRKDLMGGDIADTGFGDSGFVMSMI